MTTGIQAPSLPQTTKQLEIIESSAQQKTKQNRKGNPFMRAIKPEMLEKPYEMAEAQNIRSDLFCYEKTSQMIISPLDLQNKEDWLAYAEEAWNWHEKKKSRKSFEAIKKEITKLGLGEDTTQAIFSQLELDLRAKL